MYFHAQYDKSQSNKTLFSGWMAPWHSPAAPPCSREMSSHMKALDQLAHYHDSDQVSLATAGWVVESMAACNGILAVQQVPPHHHRQDHKGVDDDHSDDEDDEDGG